MSKTPRTASGVVPAVRASHDAPLGLLYWLEHVPPETNWLTAPRPAWLAFLARVEGLIGPAKLERIEQIASESEAEAAARRDGTYPLVIGAENLRKFIEEIK